MAAVAPIENSCLTITTDLCQVTRVLCLITVIVVGILGTMGILPLEPLCLTVSLVGCFKLINDFAWNIHKGGCSVWVLTLLNVCLTVWPFLGFGGVISAPVVGIGALSIMGLTLGLGCALAIRNCYHKPLPPPPVQQRRGVMDNPRMQAAVRQRVNAPRAQLQALDVHIERLNAEVAQLQALEGQRERLRERAAVVQAALEDLSEDEEEGLPYDQLVRAHVEEEGKRIQHANKNVIQEGERFIMQHVVPHINLVRWNQQDPKVMFFVVVKAVYEYSFGTFKTDALPDFFDEKYKANIKSLRTQKPTEEIVRLFHEDNEDCYQQFCAGEAGLKTAEGKAQFKQLIQGDWSQSMLIKQCCKAYPVK